MPGFSNIAQFIPMKLLAAKRSCTPVYCAVHSRSPFPIAGGLFHRWVVSLQCDSACYYWGHAEPKADGVCAPDL